MVQKELIDLLRCIKGSRRMLVPPTPGFDSGVHDVGKNCCVVIATDPCINVPIEHFGWLLLHYSASDVSIFGASPQFCAIDLLGPPGTSNLLKRIMKQVCAAADELRTLIVTGHTGEYEGLGTIAGVSTVYGFLHRKNLVTPAGARPGHLLLCTKPIGLEIMTNLAIREKALAEKVFGARRTRFLARQIRLQSCVRDAHLLARTRSVSAMHDVTEGGLVASLNEMADASDVGFALDYEKLALSRDLKTLANHFNLSRDQILSMSSTGTLLAAVLPQHEPKALGTLRQRGISARTIGIFTESKERVIRYNGRTITFPRRFDDPYATIVSAGLGNRSVRAFPSIAN